MAKKSLIAVISVVATTGVFAQTVTFNFSQEQGAGKPAGTIDVTETEYGLLFTPHLHDIAPGLHGFHVHQNPDCGNNAMAAGGHLDPKETKKHLGPYNDNGHLGDLPALFAAADGTVTLPVLAPRLKHLSDINNHSLMVHSGGDNYSDTPQALGGGAARMACAVVK